MGNFEKLVVLAVLLLSAVVLAVALNRDEAGQAAASPLDAARARLNDAEARDVPPAESARALDEGAETSAPGYLLYGEVQPDLDSLPAARPGSPETAEAAAQEERSGYEGPSPADADGARAPRSRILRSSRGLEPSVLEDFMLYEVAQGDTWSGLATRLYGGGRYAANLRMANEGLTELEAGRRIFVPVFDFESEASDRSSLAPGTARTTEASAPVGSVSTQSASPAPPSAPRSDAEREALLAATVYEVRSGDSLSVISQRVYGTATRWREIFEANQSVLTSPHWLQVGTRLVIPRGQPHGRAMRATAQPSDDRPRVR